MTSFQDTSSSPDAPGWTLCDPRPIQAENPYTFFTPNPQSIDALQAGDLVKLIFEGTGRDAEFVERMWVTFDRREGDICTGRLANEPYDLSTLRLHQTIEFAPHHIIVIHEPRASDPERDAFEGAMLHGVVWTLRSCPVRPVLTGWNGGKEGTSTVLPNRTADGTSWQIPPALKMNCSLSQSGGS